MTPRLPGATPCATCAAIARKLLDFPELFTRLTPAEQRATAEAWVLGRTNPLGIARHRKDCPGSTGISAERDTAAADGPQAPLGASALGEGLAGPEHSTPGSARVAPPRDSDASRPHA